MRKTKKNNVINRGGSATVVALPSNIREIFNLDERCSSELREEMKVFEALWQSEQNSFLHETIKRSLAFKVRSGKSELTFWDFLPNFGHPRAVLELRRISESIKWAGHMCSSSDCSDSESFGAVVGCHETIWDGFRGIRDQIANVASHSSWAVRVSEDVSVWGN